MGFSDEGSVLTGGSLRLGAGAAGRTEAEAAQPHSRLHRRREGWAGG
jgi:hypothetical protein